MSLIMRKKQFKFDVKLDVEELSSVPFVSGALFAKVRLVNGGSFTDYTNRVEVTEHRVHWRKHFQFTCKMVASVASGVLEQCNCRISVRKELKGGRSYQKLGFADINLAQFAGAGCTTHRYLLDGYSSKCRQDNSTLKVVIDMTLLSGDPCFKVPTVKLAEPVLSCDEIDGGALHSGNKGGSEEGAGDGGFTTHPNVVSSLPDPFSNHSEKETQQSSPMSTSADELGQTKRQLSSGSGSGSLTVVHTRQSSADSALIRQHNRSVSNGSADVGIHYGSIPRPGKKTEAQSMAGERLMRTRVDPNELVDELMSDINFDNASNSEGSGSLQLFVAKDGTAVLGSRTKISSTSSSVTLASTNSKSQPAKSADSVHHLTQPVSALP